MRAIHVTQSGRFDPRGKCFLSKITFKLAGDIDCGDFAGKGLEWVSKKS